MAEKNIFYCNVIGLILSFLLLILSFIVGDLFFILFSILIVLLSIKLLRETYRDFVVNNRRYKQLTVEEQEIVEDAINLIKSIDENIVISDFNVYKVNILLPSLGLFAYDSSTDELCIFIPFNFLLRFLGKDICFTVVLHEILHAQNQNQKSKVNIFNKKFKEGLNQLLTMWLIDNYSEKYKIPKRKDFLLNFKKFSVLISIFPLARTAYVHEVDMVEEIIENSEMDIKEVFLKYIDMDPEFFRSFVPLEHFKIINETN